MEKTKREKVDEYITKALSEEVLSTIPERRREDYVVLVENEKNVLYELAEMTTTQHIDRVASLFLPTIKKLMRESFIDKLVGVQPIQEPVAILYYVDFHYSNTGGGATAGESAIDKVTTDYTIAPNEGTAIQHGFHISIREKEVKAQTRKILTKFTLEAEEFAGKYGINLDKELIRLASTKIVEEINYEILRDLYNASTSLGVWTAPTPADTPDVKDRKERELYYVIEDVIMQIAERTNRLPNWIVVSPKVASILKRTNLYVARDAGVPRVASSLYIAGTLSDEYEIFVIPKLSAILPPARANDILVGYKGTTELEAGAFFLPHTPLKVLDKVVDPTTWVVLRSLGSSYAKAITMPTLFGRIEVNGL